MNEEVIKQMAATAERLASAAEALDRVLGRLDAQQEALNAKVDRIVAAIEEQPQGADNQELAEQVSALQKANDELRARAARLSRKTLSPLITALLGKSEPESGEKLEAAVLDKTLQPLSIEQRIAVKAEMARAGLLE
jgi:predicted RNase H-like nuclease (RuvC/YqgF family)